MVAQSSDESKPAGAYSSAATDPKPEQREAGTVQAPGAASDKAKDIASEVIEDTKGAAQEVISQASEAAAEVVISAAEQFASQAPEIAQRIRNQAGVVAKDLYQHGGEYLSRNVQANPLISLLIAGAVGYGLGYLLSRR